MQNEESCPPCVRLQQRIYTLRVVFGLCVFAFLLLKMISFLYTF